MRKQSWHCLYCTLPSEHVEDISARCFELGSCGLQTDEEGDEVFVRAYFDEELDVRQIRRDLEEYLQARQIEGSEVGMERVEEEDWEKEWRRFFRPIWATPRIVVHPSWIPLEVEPDQIAIVVDPKMAFGTGGHESTRLCLQALEDFLRAGDKCLDLGTGSGILAMAAVRLGAGSVLAVDVDPRAEENAGENLRRNGIAGGMVEVRQGSIEVAGGESFDLVLANIQSHILTPMLEEIRRALVPGGKVLFSGLLIREGEGFAHSCERTGLQVLRFYEENEWTCIVAGREG